ncbi:MAG TPA: hypothetical protein PKJ10_04175 [Smithella sp.]|nr:hypothetical protein [Smithella sp.]
MKLLAISGALLILLSIATAWLTIVKKYLSLQFMERAIRDDEKLVKAHIDFVIMGLILLVFFLTGADLPFPVILLSCAGALANPSLFLFLAFKPDVNRKPGSLFSVISTMTFLTTTGGIGGASFCIILAMIR